MTNLDTAASSGYNLIFGIGFALRDSIEKVKKAIIDGKIIVPEK